MLILVGDLIQTRPSLFLGLDKHAIFTFLHFSARTFSCGWGITTAGNSSSFRWLVFDDDGRMVDDG